MSSPSIKKNKKKPHTHPRVFKSWDPPKSVQIALGSFSTIINDGVGGEGFSLWRRRGGPFIDRCYVAPSLLGRNRKAWHLRTGLFLSLSLVIAALVSWEDWLDTSAKVLNLYCKWRQHSVLVLVLVLVNAAQLRSWRQLFLKAWNALNPWITASAYPWLPHVWNVFSLTAPSQLFLFFGVNKERKRVFLQT